MDSVKRPYVSNISKSLLKIHEKVYIDGVNGGILVDHFLSLEHGLKFLERFLEVSENKDLIMRITRFLSYLQKELYLLRYLEKDESLVMKLDHAYAYLRKEMENVIIKPGTNEYDVIFPEIFSFGISEYDMLFPEIFTDQLIPKTSTGWYVFRKTNFFLCEEIKKLMTSYCKADQIAPMMNEMEDIWMLASHLEPFFMYAKYVSLLSVKEEEKKIFDTITTMLDRAACFIYLSFVGKMDDEMFVSLKNSLSDLIIEETQIMKMYRILDIDSTRNIKSHIYMSLRLLEWNKKCYLGTERGGSLEDHFMSIKQGLKILAKIFKFSRDTDLGLHIQHIVAIVKQKLHLLSHNQKDENLIVNLDHAYGELRDEMRNVFIKPGTHDYYSLFPNIILEGHYLNKFKDFLLKKIRKLLTSSCKADQITPIMNELEELRLKLETLKPLFDSVITVRFRHHVKEGEYKILAALITSLDRAICLTYLSFVGHLNEDMLVSLRKKISLLIEETKAKEMSLMLESDIDISLSLLKRQEEYAKGTTNEAMIKDHIMSLKHGVEFLKWLPQIYTDIDLEQRIILSAGNVKQKLESLTFEQLAERLNMDVNGAYADLGEEMKNVIINKATHKYYTFSPKQSSMGAYSRRNNDFLVEKITTLVTSNCRDLLKKELQDLQKMLTSLKPLCPYIEYGIPWLGNRGKSINTILTFYNQATRHIYLSSIGYVNLRSAFWVKRNIETTVKKTDVRQMYTAILNEVLSKMTDYIEEDLYLLENLLFLLKCNIESFNNASSKLYAVLTDTHIFLLGLHPNVLLKKLHLVQESFQAILCHSIPIVCSCYLEHPEIDVSAELNFVLGLIKHIKSEAQEIKLYYFPRTDYSGFLEFFSRYLEDLMANQELPVKEEIVALHFEFHSLLSLAKVTNPEELDGSVWTDIINMAYQAEYIIDLYLVSSSRDFGLVSSLSKIIQKLKGIRTDVQSGCLAAQNVAVTSKLQVLSTTTQVSDIDAIVGLQEEARMIMDYLLKGQNKLDVISIIGMAGIGKTTLASSIYKTPLVALHFDILAWCTVSQSYKNKDLFLAILDQVNAFDTKHRSISDDEELADHICRNLKKRRYLIVLDDIWDTTLWKYLKRYLPDDRNGSRILITTRNKDVADQIESKVNELHGLSEEKSWELFQKRIIKKDCFSDNILKISKGIVEHCKGLPLSIVIIAGVLSDIERTEKKWNQIAETVSSIILSDPQGKCKAILELSYNHLPNHLRSCFLYLGSFPEDKEISVDHLIIRWIVEGLVRDTKSDNAEEVAKKYIDDLIVKSLVIPAKERSRGGVRTFRIHDLLRDFCLDKAKEKHFFTLMNERNYSPPIQDPRRLIINGPHIFKLHFSCHSIRSLICFYDLEASEIEDRIRYCDMVLLKVLEVGSSNHFPNISSLVHLSYLALGSLNQNISVLPSSISKLKNLQILILNFHCDVIEVPNFIFDMVKLRHVHITPEASFQVESNRFRKSSSLLENLRSLSNARVSSGDSEWLNKLLGLQRLCCVFFDDDLEEDDDREDEDLEDNDDREEDGDLKEKQFRMLSFNQHLTSLKVENAAGSDKRFIHICQLPMILRELTLSEFFLTSNDISEIGRTLPHLEIFKIYGCHVPSGYEWNVDDEDFPELKVLKLSDLKISRWIATENSFPSLEQLWVEDCDYLDEIPLDFGYLLKLRLITVRDCAPSVDDSAREIEKLQLEEQNTEMKVLIYPKI